MIFNLFKKKNKAVRYIIHVDLIKGGVLTSRMFSPLTRTKARAIEYIMIVAQRQGYEGIKRR